MSTSPSAGTLAIVAETLPLMEQHRASLEEGLERSLASQRGHDPSSDRSRETVRAIIDLLLDQARRLDSGASTAGLAETAQRHRALAIGSGHYSRFGDALKPAMKDVLGSQATPLVLAAWGAAYWAIVRRLFVQQVRLAA